MKLPNHKIIVAVIAFLVVVIPLVLFFIPKFASASSLALFWPIESVDTMKYSRDPSRDPNIYKHIPELVKDVATLHPTYIAIATPYDEEFYPVLKAWVTEARKYNLKIWFRGNFSGWEGWFGYPRFTEVTEHHKLTKAFILKYPDLFENGDIFTPVPEAENGGMGDPRGSDQKAADFNQFLIDSYNNCVASFAQINKQVNCGYFSMNGDIAKTVLTPETVKQIGNVVVIDHYVDSPNTMASDLDYLYNKFHAKIILGEFGAPIPDINGQMTEGQQANFIQSLLNVFVQKRDIVGGINYWVIQGGSTSLVNDDGSFRKAAGVLENYYNPYIVKGKVMDTAGNTVSDVTISTTDEMGSITSDKNGNYILPITPHSSITVVVSKMGYKDTEETVSVDTSKKINTQDLVITPKETSILFNFISFLRHLFMF